MAVSSPLPEWLDPEIPKQLANQSDRGTAIIGGALVEYYLEKLLLARMRTLSKKKEEYLFEHFGPLATPASKIEMGFALNLYGEMARNDLNLINSIRNKFAHEIKGTEWTFDHPEIKAKGDSFYYAKKIAPATGMPPVNNRGKFVGAVYYYSAQLYGEVIANPQTMFSPKFLVE